MRCHLKCKGCHTYAECGVINTHGVGRTSFFPGALGEDLFPDFSGGRPHSVACGSVSPASNLAVAG